MHTIERDVTISGERVYRIQVSPVGTNEWRAQVLARHGGPTALMPFYGPTPDAAAERLEAWLVRAHRSVASTSPVPP